MILTKENVKTVLQDLNPIQKIRVYGTQGFNRYKLLSPIKIKLSNDTIIDIPAGFTWDASYVPKVFWFLCSSDNDAEVAYLIHSFLYDGRLLPKDECDTEMYLWAKELNTTKWNLDNKLRYLASKYFGDKSYNK